MFIEVHNSLISLVITFLQIIVPVNFLPFMIILAEGWTTTTQEDTQYGVSTFGEGNDGELYFADINTGIIYHIIDNSPVASNILEISKTKFYPNPTKSWKYATDKQQ